ncbi:glycosyltransferase family protein [Inediibacterium massiliense]|uniref:glycosyltransferase family protein n=1 Tax=Inediibacterium massiliense TaxID=1658111 RepID=UPI0006B50A74|nr:glycosyltransferase family protein [Inediibacterium massiliense]
MDLKKICFITCVNDKQKYKTALNYINLIKNVEGIQVEKICIDDARSMTEAYNRAMERTDAKYKVYMHQDVNILNKNFIYDVINIFKSNINIGMIGMAGSKIIPKSGVYSQSRFKYGNLMHIISPTGKKIYWKFGYFKNDYEKVKCIDGLMMITQYDIKWREDLFTGWHFYDISQSMEFIKAGYDVVVPKMEKVWCVHNCKRHDHQTYKDYDKYREIFIERYMDYLE